MHLVYQIIADVTDETLTELYALVMGIDIDAAVADVMESATGNGGWKPNYARVFLSHSAKHKKFVGDVADELALVGVHGFVAHDTMAFSKPWQSQIEQALRSMQVYVAIIHLSSTPALGVSKRLVGHEAAECPSMPCVMALTLPGLSDEISGQALPVKIRHR